LGFVRLASDVTLTEPSLLSLAVTPGSLKGALREMVMLPEPCMVSLGGVVSSFLHDARNAAKQAEAIKILFIDYLILSVKIKSKSRSSISGFKKY
jgi:hypothetical protein